MDGSISRGILPSVGTYVENGVVSVGRMYISFDTLDIPKNIRIKSASLKLKQFGYEVTEETNLPKLCICDAQGIEIASGSTITAALGSALDYEQLKTSADPTEDVVSYTFDITQFLNAASNNNLANSTLAVRLVDESYTANNYIAFYGCSYSKNYPEITITYETDYSVNSSAHVHTHDLGRFGTGMIDLRYGNLMFESEDFAWAGNKMPVTIKHIYNSALAGYRYTNNSAIELHAADFSAMNIGLGWRLNLMQSMVSAKFTHEDILYSGYVYVDESGAETHFIPGDNGYEDVDGMGMVYSASNRELKIGSETYTFDTAGRLIKAADEYDNAMEITYTDGRISTVTDGAGREFLFAYSFTGDLTSITAPDGTVVWDYVTSLFKLDKANRTLSVGTTVISTAIDALIAAVTNGLIYRGLKMGMKLLLANKSVRNAFINVVLDFFLNNFWGKKLLWLIYKIALGIAGKDGALGTVTGSVFTGYLSSILSFKNNLLSKASSIISALSSIGGIVALLLDFSDKQWDDYVTIQY